MRSHSKRTVAVGVLRGRRIWHPRCFLRSLGHVAMIRSAGNPLLWGSGCSVRQGGVDGTASRLLSLGTLTDTANPMGSHRE